MKRNHLAVAVLTSLAPLSAFALGIGNLTVFSALNEPFRAEIPLYQLNGSSLSGIKIDLASKEDYEKINLEHHDVLASFSFEVKKDKHGLAIVRVSTQDRLTEPYIELLIRVVTSQGEFFRQFTVLLDPPIYQTTGLPVVKKQLEIKGVQVCLGAQDPCNYPVSAIESINLTSTMHPSVQTMHSSIQSLYATLGSKEPTYGPILPEDRIWDIATQYKKSGLSINQVVLAIVGTNSKAFTQGNLNGLKLGEHLQIPQQEEIRRVPADFARQEVAAHESAWKFKREIQHVLLPPYIDGIRGISQFDTNSHTRHTVSNNLSDQSIRIPHNVFAFNENQAGTRTDINSQTDIKPMSGNQTVTDAIPTVKASSPDMNQANILLNALQEENKKLALQMQSLIANFADLQKQIDMLIKINHSQTASPHASGSENSILRHLIDFLIMIGSFICGIFTSHLISSRRTHTQKEPRPVYVNGNMPDNKQPPEVSPDFHVQEAMFVPASPTQFASSVPLAPAPEVPTADIHAGVTTLSEDSHIDDSKQIDFTLPPKPSQTVEQQTSEPKQEIHQKIDHKPADLPMFKQKPVQSNDYLISFDFNEPANNAPVHAPQPTPNESIQTAINAPVEPQTVKPTVLQSVPVESREPLVLFHFNQAEHNVPVQASQYIRHESIHETISAPVNPQAAPQHVEPTVLQSIPAESNDQLISFRGNEPVSDTPVQASQPTQHESIQETISAPLEPQTVLEPTVLQSVPESNDPLISFHFNKSESDSLLKSSQPISTPANPDMIAFQVEQNVTAQSAEPLAPILNMTSPEFQSSDELIPFDIEDVQYTETISEPSLAKVQIPEEMNTNLTKSSSALNTLLDLAKAYISMGDIEAAKQALEEVIEHGDVQLANKAQSMMHELNG